MKRLFIAINLPPHLKKIIAKSVDNLISIRCGGLPDEAKNIRWLSPENWHLTISFLGYQPDEAIGPILESIKETVKEHSNILKNVGMSTDQRGVRVEFEKIIWAPPDKPARMIWLTGTKETSKKLDEIKNHLENELIKNDVKFQPENRSYNAHLTLARFQPAPINMDTISINQFLNQHKSALSFQAQSLDLMESHLKRTGAEYEILTSVNFQKV